MHAAGMRCVEAGGFLSLSLSLSVSQSRYLACSGLDRLNHLSEELIFEHGCRGDTDDEATTG